MRNVGESPPAFEESSRVGEVGLPLGVAAVAGVGGGGVGGGGVGGGGEGEVMTGHLRYSC